MLPLRQRDETLNKTVLILGTGYRKQSEETVLSSTMFEVLFSLWECRDNPRLRATSLQTRPIVGMHAFSLNISD